MNEKLVTVYKNNSSVQIEAIKAFLESHGINCFVKGDTTVNPYAWLTTHIELQVQEKDKDFPLT